MVLWQVLVEFVFRISFGVALSMTLTSAKQVNSGFFRVHMWVLMGANTLAALVLYSNLDAVVTYKFSPSLLLWLAGYCAVMGYVGAVAWMYEKAAFGKFALTTIWIAAAIGAIYISGGQKPPETSFGWHIAEAFSGGLLLGSTLTAMLLGHWYLNSPGMKLGPLYRLLFLMAFAIVFRTVVVTGGAVLQFEHVAFDTQFWIFLGLRWLAGIVSPIVLVVMTWFTLRIPNTQSATGILYAAVILVFIGELSSQLLSAGTAFPL